FSPDSSRIVTERWCDLPNDYRPGVPLTMLVETDIASGEETELGVLSGNPDWPQGLYDPKTPWFLEASLQALAYDRAYPDRVLLLRGNGLRPVAPFSILALQRTGLRELSVMKTLALGANDQKFGLEARFPPVLTSEGRLILFSSANAPARGLVEHLVERD